MFLQFINKKLKQKKEKEDINTIRARYETLKGEYFNLILRNNKILRAIRDRTNDLSSNTLIYDDFLNQCNEYKSDINYGIERAIEFNCKKSKEIQENA